MLGMVRSCCTTAVALLIAEQAVAFGASGALFPGGPLQVRLAGKLTDVEPSKEELASGRALTLQLLDDVTLFLDQPARTPVWANRGSVASAGASLGPFRTGCGSLVTRHS